MGTSVLPGGLGTGCPPGSIVDPTTGECVPDLTGGLGGIVIVPPPPINTGPPPTLPGQPPTRTSTTSNPRQGGTRIPPTFPGSTTPPPPAPPGGREPGSPSVPYIPPGRIGLWGGPVFNQPSTSTSSSVTTTTGGESTPGGGEGPIFVNTTNLVSVTDQSASNAVQNVASAVQAGIDQSVQDASTVAQNTYNQIQGEINSNVSAVSQALGIADNSIGGAIQGIEGGIQATLGGIGTTIAQGIANSLNPATIALEQIALIISQQIGGLAGAIARAVAAVIPAIIGAITGTLDPVTAVLRGIEGEISSQVVSLTQLGSDVTGGFGSLDSTLGRLLSDWESYNSPFVESQTGYPDGGNLHSDLSAIVKALAGFVESGGPATVKLSDQISPPCPSILLQHLLNDPLNLGEGGILSPFVDLVKLIGQLAVFLLKGLPAWRKINDLVGQNVNLECPSDTLPASALVEAVQRGFMSDTQALDEAARGNLSRDRFAILRDLAVHQFAPNELLEAVYRSIIPDADFAAALAQQGWTAGQISTLKALGVSLLTASEAQMLVQRGLIGPDAQDAILKSLRYDDTQRKALQDLTFRPPNMSEAIAGLSSERALNDLGVAGAADVFTIPDPVISAANNEGLDPQTRALRWYDHWQFGGIAPWLTLYYRSQITRQQLDAVFVKEQIPLPIGDAIINSGRPIIQFRTIATMVQLKLITVDQGRVLLKEHGYDDAHANILLTYAQRPLRSQAAKNAAAQHSVSLAIAKEEYIDGSITGDQFLAILTQHGFTVDGANTELQVVDAHQAMLARKASAQFVVDQYGAGLIDINTALAELAAQGLTVQELAKAEHRIRAFKTSRTKIPSESDLNHFLQLSIISPQTYVSQLEAQGYTEQASKWFLSWRQHPTQTTTGQSVPSALPPGG